MSLYNDARPRRFGAVLGQGHITGVLQRQAQTGEYHHAYLLQGPSGTGKTTTARILASVLTCDCPQSGEPCGECRNCQAVQRGSHWDVQEIDAARLNRIDDIRELAYRASYAPMGRRKVYILDEAHRLSAQAWDGLLKTLEEPLPYLVMVLCSTEGDRIPETVRSRCLVCDFHELKASVISDHLASIARTKGVEIDESALRMMEEMACGNMRTTLNSLEQQLAVTSRLAGVWLRRDGTGHVQTVMLR